MKISSPASASRSIHWAGAAMAATALASLLSACYVVPLDPRTGQPYPAAQLETRGTGGSVTVVTPPAPSGPPAVTTLNARLYPLNPQANKAGLVNAVVVDNNAGHGTFTLSYLGDSMQGEASRVDANYSFGRIYSEVLGTSQRTYNGRRGIANAYGAKGVNVQCEYLVTGPSTGTGACQFSDGAKYQMYFGS